MPLARPLADPLVELCAHQLRVLGQPLRIRVIDLLDRVGETNVQTLVDALDVGQQNLSKHLAVLHGAGVLRRRRDGREVHYELADPDAITLIIQVAERILRQLHDLDASGRFE